MMHSMSPDIVRGLCLEWVIMDFWTTALSQDVAADLNRRIAELERQLKATAAENARLLCDERRAGASDRDGRQISRLLTLERAACVPFPRRAR
jgi:hypothetical protein